MLWKLRENRHEKRRSFDFYDWLFVWFYKVLNLVVLALVELELWFGYQRRK